MTALAYPNLWAPALPALCPWCGKRRLRDRFRRWRDRLRNPFGLLHPANGDEELDVGGEILLDASGKRQLDDGTLCGCCGGGSSGCFTGTCADYCSVFPSSARVTFSGVEIDAACHLVAHDFCGAAGVCFSGGRDWWFQHTNGAALGSYCIPNTGNCVLETFAIPNTTAVYSSAGCSGAPFGTTGYGIEISRLDASTWIVSVGGALTASAFVFPYIFIGTATVTDCTKSFQVRNLVPGFGVPFSGFPIASCAPLGFLGCCVAMGKSGSALVEMCC